MTDNFLKDLMSFYLSMPNGRDKLELYKIITLMKSGNINVKDVILRINNNILLNKSVKNKNNTLREQSIKVWESILNLFTSHLKGI